MNYIVELAVHLLPFKFIFTFILFECTLIKTNKIFKNNRYTFINETYVPKLRF